MRNVTLELTEEEAGFVINAIAQMNPLIKKIAEQVQAQAQQLQNGELKHGDIDPQRRPAGGAKA